MTDENETNQDRYVLDIKAGRVQVLDSLADESATFPVKIFVGPERLDRALMYVQRLNEDWVRHHMIQDNPGPHAFLASLPAYAKAQRADALLAELGRCEDEALKMVNEGAALLRRATDIRNRLQSQLSATQSAQAGSAPRGDTPVPPTPSEAEYASLPILSRETLAEFEAGSALYRPQPY